jgi:RNA polymerase sigma-70 factor (ECF subfamily)
MARERTTGRHHVCEPPRVLVRLGGSGGFESFYRSEMPRLTALARALCGQNVAEDIAQEAMLAALRRWAEVSSLDRPEAWVRRVCVNLANSSLRRRGVEARVLLRLTNLVATQAPLTPVHEAFWAEVRRLPRRQAQAAALRYVYDLSVADIASTLGCSQGSVKVHLTRARRALAERMGVSPEDEP